MHFGDYIFIFLLALILFGPKKLPEIARQVGKLMMEFRRASNDFKMQMEEELRNLEAEERKKKLEAVMQEQQNRVLAAAPQTEPLPADPAEIVEPRIMPPSTGLPVSADRPYAHSPNPDPAELNIIPSEPQAAEIAPEPTTSSEGDPAIHHA